ncbi:MAG: DUF3095 domain-containing protein [Candidatus Viridilinea halotolerans]|uniref:DUF3095 domain-containing protein n=1 Tax=Candidatus Viridilinea halotolerans TaxID=2491704 RepID=A0A426U7A2_9CHLR|nr:MAG: DUF3095 domain-containing protein [Candidatus Viridilinea halotolerans]
MNNDDFYANLSPLSDFAALTEEQNFTPLPDDWHVVVTDVLGSTQAIAAGRYKEVNLLGAASIVALLNLAGPLDLPFIFGGDGASLAIPSSLLAPTRTALAGLRSLAKQRYELDLRVGVVPVADLRAAEQEVRVARLPIAEHYTQAMFSGGIAYAESLIKDPARNHAYLIAASDNPDAPDLSGLECRWQDVPSRHGEVVSLLVMPQATADASRAATLSAVLAALQQHFGSDSDYHPLATSQLQASLVPAALRAEAQLRSPAAFGARLRYQTNVWLMIFMLRFYRQYERLLGRPPWWDRYRSLAFTTTDYKKYDDTLRMVLAGNTTQRTKLAAWLEEQYQAGRLLYGMHVADRAILTCLVFERMGRQVHFVDGADGGYALAARALKERLAAR